MSSTKGQGPRLFIHQPITTTPVKNMQEVFRSKEEIREEKIKEEKKRRKTVATKEEDLVPIDISVQEEEHKEKQHTSLKKVKSFKDMDLMERIDYLVHFPKMLPPVPCVFYTDSQNYQGYLSEYQDNLVTIQFHDQTKKTISLKELKNVVMIGIKNK
ncbi:CotO family spore coat protein [Neobacillus massiliamazoniensis]|uniref:Signal recognition particle receptor protein FtsY n=1 Tax=Neobacillus massiliamazoniensis TaxID=1499688 RepID=A0A0U1NZN8_9BACI|nr:CotO family spore coat protein [Neobacillus massiliamazoniensis]CRK83446.1 Signal recognition particle receptor protein FtsY [Neobacillus massiliamazoniensis]